MAENTKVKKLADEVDELRPIVITDNETGDQYTLEYDAESVSYAEGRQFKINDVEDYPVTGIRDLFVYAFRKHHKMLPREKAIRIYELTKPLPQGCVERLIKMFMSPYNGIVVAKGEERKNERMTVEM